MSSSQAHRNLRRPCDELKPQGHHNHDISLCQKRLTTGSPQKQSETNLWWTHQRLTRTMISACSPQAHRKTFTTGSSQSNLRGARGKLVMSTWHHLICMVKTRSWQARRKLMVSLRRLFARSIHISVWEYTSSTRVYRVWPTPPLNVFPGYTHLTLI